MSYMKMKKSEASFAAAIMVFEAVMQNGNKPDSRQFKLIISPEKKIFFGTVRSVMTENNI